MRFLKNKIAQVKAFRDSQAKSLQDQDSQLKSQESVLIIQEALKESQPNQIKIKKACSEREDGKATKNIVQNFGRAICTFAVSNIADPYLIPLLEEEQLTLKDFKDYMKQTKDAIKGLAHFRAALMTFDHDSLKTQALKKVFRLIGEVFIKNFSVNWITHGKINYKKAYLKYRFKMLRRIQSPELFTYLRSS